MLSLVGLDLNGSSRKGSITAATFHSSGENPKAVALLRDGGTVALLTFPDQGVVVAAASNISPAEGVDPTGRKIAETQL